MKQFIVILAVLPLMLVFLAQFTLDQINDGKISAVNSIVYSAKERAKQDGYFTDENKQQMIEKIKEACGAEDADIAVVSADSNPRQRLSGASAKWEDDLIFYEVRVTMSGIIAGGDMFGIKDADNKRCYVIKAYTASEYLP